MDYLKILKESYEDELESSASMHGDYDYTKLEFIGEHIFGFVTYESEVLKEMAKLCLDVCLAITHRQTFDYISMPERNVNYLMMINMQFFDGRLDWGTSIRGAWWCLDQKLTTSSLMVDGEQIHGWEFTSDEFCSFIDSIAEFVKDQQPLTK